MDLILTDEFRAVILYKCFRVYKCLMMALWSWILWYIWNYVTVKVKLCDWWSFTYLFEYGMDPRSSNREEFIERTCKLSL